MQKSGIVSDSFVDVALVSRQKVSELANRYLEETGVEAGDHAVLSFPDSEVERPFVASPDSNLYLGEIVINYPKAVELAGKSGKFVEQIVLELAEHGTLHLAGIHHD